MSATVIKRVVSAALFLVLTAASAMGRCVDKYVTIDPATIKTVSGTKLMFYAYGTIFTLLVIYILRLFIKTRRINREASRLLNEIMGNIHTEKAVWGNSAKVIKKSNMEDVDSNSHYLSQ
jgi:hypothetical protein